MTWIKDYIVPSLIVLIVSLLVCLGLWGVFISTQDTSLDGEETTSIVVETTEEELPIAVGFFTPILLFIANGLKVGIFIGVPALITLFIVRRLNTDKSSEKMATS